jgi:dephospho-CoA kinase
MFSVGLTGGIASGKTTVSNLFADLGVPVIDTDVISRNLLNPGEPAFDQVTAHFGAAILTPDGRIDRTALRNIVFSDPQQKSWIEKMLHPLIYQHSHDAMVKHSAATYVLVVVPLLFETNFQSLVDRILVVDCPAEQQIIRLMKRDNIDEALARKMLAQQMSNAQRLSKAHDIIKNDDENSDLSTQVASLH